VIELKVLHIWNTAGVGSIIAKYMDKIYGTESWVIMRKSFDRFGFTTYGEYCNHNAYFFALKALLKAAKYDIIHVHAFDRIVPFLKSIYNKPLILHYHGTDIRGKWNERRKYWKKADIVLYSTRDLKNGETPKHAIWLPNPVDTELFYEKHPVKYPRTALTMSYKANDIAKQIALNYKLKLVIHDRKNNLIPYRELADILCDYEYYIDAKRTYYKGKHILIKDYSKTALEALACNRKVIRWDGRIVENLPEQHKPHQFVKKLYKIYSFLL